MKPSGAGWLGENPGAYDAFLVLLGGAYAEASRLLPVGTPLTAERVASVTRGAADLADRKMAEHRPGIEAHHGRRIACKSGCSHCCYQLVYASTSQLALIAWAGRGEDAALIRQAASDQAAAIVGLSATARYQRGIACGMLDRATGQCGIYDVRPALCRGYASLSRLACDRDWRDRFKPGAKPGVPQVGQFQLLAVAASHGVDLAVQDHGLHCANVELGRGIARMMEPGVLDAWLAGEPVFTPAEERGGQPLAETLALMRRRIAVPPVNLTAEKPLINSILQQNKSA